MPLETIYRFVRRERKSNKKQKDQEKYVAVVAYIAHKKREAEYLWNFEITKIGYFEF